MKDSENVYIAKINSLENEVRYVEIKKFPTIMLFKASEKWKPVTYLGELNEEGLVKFLRENDVKLKLKDQQSDL